MSPSQGSITNRDFTRSSEVVRIGVFNAINENGYLTFDPTDRSLKELARQPASRYLNTAKDFFASTSGNATMAVDPSRGALLKLVIRTPSFAEQVNQGGYVGYTIIAIGLLGLAIAIYRLVSLQITGGKIARQLKSDQASENNPLGRILTVYEENKNAEIDTLDLKLDEAIIREAPKLEAFQGMIKVFAGIAPLMGLLGTVVGMIPVDHPVRHRRSEADGRRHLAGARHHGRRAGGRHSAGIHARHRLRQEPHAHRDPGRAKRRYDRPPVRKADVTLGAAP